MFDNIKYEQNGEMMTGHVKVEIWVEEGALHYSKENGYGNEPIQDAVSDVSVEEFSKQMEALKIEGWKKSYTPVGVLVMDGSTWSVRYETEDDKPVKVSGENAYPVNWKKFIKTLKTVVGDFDDFD